MFTTYTVLFGLVFFAHFDPAAVQNAAILLLVIMRKP
jgi:hypothetical protein